MLKMKEVTKNWMNYMISRNFPPLTPHHTQAFTVLMMSRFFGDYLKDAMEREKPKEQARCLPPPSTPLPHDAPQPPLPLNRGAMLRCLPPLPPPFCWRRAASVPS